MTIANIVRAACGRTHGWRVERDGQTATLWHYSTAMLTWRIDQPADPDALDFSTGWGSVSDQNGMNTAFKVLGLPYRFDRDQRGGGPRITPLDLHPCGHATHPGVVCTCPRHLSIITGIAA
jgi:hypothetical protein